jgi:hypothetical protein
MLVRSGFRVENLRHWNTTALPLQFLWESVLRRELKDDLRYGPDNRLGSIHNAWLAAWYCAIENRIPFPIGVSLFAVAELCA